MKLRRETVGHALVRFAKAYGFPIELEEGEDWDTKLSEFMDNYTAELGRYFDDDEFEREAVRNAWVNTWYAKRFPVVGDFFDYGLHFPWEK